jgi:[acyl-carrier-protein] S-malonyltransferase
MSNPIILCPGQGAQAVGMGKAWFDGSPEARSVFEAADKQLGNRLGAPLTKLCFEGPAEALNKTDVSQPAIYTTSVACWRGLLAMRGMHTNDPALAATAGLSLGEYTALHIAGAMTFEDGLELVTLRGRAMQDAAETSAGGMVALIGATDAQAEEVCAKAKEAQVLVCANFNAPGQVVLSGHKSACERAAKVADGMGLKSSMLPVAGAFHSPLMAPAATRLEQALAKTRIQPPRCQVVSNVTALPHEVSPSGGPDTIRRRLVEQLTSPVRWAQGCQWLVAHVKGDYLEMAPGRTLMGLMRRIDKTVKVTTHDTPQ